MKTIISIIIAVVVLGTTSVQEISAKSSKSTKYHKAMGKAMRLWGEKKSDKAIAMFERISQAEKDNWLPAYYASLVSVTDAFITKDKNVMDLKIKNAEKYYEIAKKRIKNNAEIHILKGMIYTAKIVFKPEVNGQLLSEPTVVEYKKALAIENNNPRAMYLLAEFNINMAKFFPMDTAPFYKQLENAVKNFDNFKAKEAFYPDWGKDRAVEVLKKKPQDEVK